MRVTATMSVLRDGQEIELEITGQYTPGDEEGPGALYQRVPGSMEDIYGWTRNPVHAFELTFKEEEEAEQALYDAMRAQWETRR